MFVFQKELPVQGFCLHHFASLESTNDAAKNFYQEHETGSLWPIHVFWADEQTKGRGRMGRTWVSDLGNLYVSFLMRSLVCSSERISELSFVFGCAVYKALEICLGNGGELLKLKWPNDILVGQAKIAGILLESEIWPMATPQISEKQPINPWVIMGTGINLNSAPSNLSYATTCLLQEGMRLNSSYGVPSVYDFLKILCMKLKEFIETWGKEGFLVIRELWLSKAAFLGEKISVNVGRKKIAGIFEGIDERGFLILRTETQMETISSGNIWLERDDENDFSS